MKIKRHRHANERAKNRTKNETHLNSHKETNHKDMIEWTTSLINIRKKEKNELWKNCYSWNLKLIYLVDWFCGLIFETTNSSSLIAVSLMLTKTQ